MDEVTVYFCGSIRGESADREMYRQIIDCIGQYGEVLTEHLSLGNPESAEKEIETSHIYERDLEWLNNCDLVVAEVSSPSLGVGYELGKAEEFDKPVLCLYRGKKSNLSAMVQGNEYFELFEYQNMDEVNKRIKEFLKALKA